MQKITRELQQPVLYGISQLRLQAAAGTLLPPTLTGVALSGTNTILVTYSEDMDSLTILNKNNYSINNDITVNTVVVLCGGKRAILTTSEHTMGTWYSLSCQ